MDPYVFIFLMVVVVACLGALMFMYLEGFFD